MSKESAHEELGKRTSQPQEDAPSPAEPKFRPFSSRDALFEKLMEIPPAQSKAESAGHDMKPAERELTLMLMLKFLEKELETLKFEAITNRDKFALECLHTIAFESTRQLLLFCMAAPEMAAEIAQHQQVWPLPYAKDTATKGASDALIDILGLGSKRNQLLDTTNVLSENTDARSWLAILAGLMHRLREESLRVNRTQELLESSDEQTSEIIAGLESIPGRNASEDQVYEHLRALVIDPDVLARLAQLFEVDEPFAKEETLRKFINNSIRLPELCADKQVVKTWMATIRELMMDIYDGHPENCSLRWMGQYLAEGKKDSSPKGTASYDSNLRAGIFQRLERTLLNIANG